MSIPKILAFVSVFLFGAILVLLVFKRDQSEVTFQELNIPSDPIEIDIAEENEVEEAAAPIEAKRTEETVVLPDSESRVTLDYDLPNADRIEEFFNKKDPRLPIVETIVYKSRVPWHKGKPAWIADYASHYKTSRHFIARGLNGSADYEKQDVKDGDKFNVLKEDKDFEFYFVIDLLTSKMWFYYIDHDLNERTLLKTYHVGLGRPDSSTGSGYLTPTGKFSLGSKVGIYRPKMKGSYQGDKVEMVRVFGTRWLPFGEEIAETTASAKGLGIHGLPLLPAANGELAENIETLGKYESDGCVRMATKDVEEIFAIVISRPTTVEIVKGFHNAKLPGVEKKNPKG
jgi:hypothetical protein